MKRHFDNREVCHVWAQQNQSEGYGSKKNIFFEGRTIYSYGRHFPMATFINPDLIMINSDSYSVSTTRHQSYVYRAIKSQLWDNRIYAPTEIVKLASGMPNINALALQKSMLEWCLARYDEAIKNATYQSTIPRRQKRVQKHIAEAADALDKGVVFSNKLGLKTPKSFLKVRADLTANNADIIASYARKIEKDKKAKEKRKREYKEALKKALPEAVRKWRNHEGFDYMTKEGNAESNAFRHAEKDYMRVNYDRDEKPLEIETSKGGKVSG